MLSTSVPIFSLYSLLMVFPFTFADYFFQIGYRINHSTAF